MDGRREEGKDGWTSGRQMYGSRDGWMDGRRREGKERYKTDHAKDAMNERT